MHKKSKEIVAIYEDSDGSFKTENAVTNGSLALKSTESQEKGEESVWDNFYSKLEEIDNYHARYGIADTIAPQENLESEVLFA